MAQKSKSSLQLNSPAETPEQKQKSSVIRFVVTLLLITIIFETVNFGLSEFADLKAYENVSGASQEEWDSVYGKLMCNEALNDSDYSIILSQTGLGRPAVISLAENQRTDEIIKYREYYLSEKNYKCVRTGIFACHEAITDAKGKRIINPPFADLKNGDIILTLSIHSLGWRHGHAAIITDCENGITAEAVMIGYDSSYGRIETWKDYPVAVVLRAKNADGETGNRIAEFAKENLLGLPYSLFAGIFDGRDFEKVPKSTQCAHLVWYAYMANGIDIDSDGGKIITPYDILNSDALEVVQVYGLQISKNQGMEK